MSVVQDKDSQKVVVEERRQVRHTLRQKPVVGTKPTITVRTRFIEKPAAKPSMLPSFATWGSFFAVAVMMTFFLSNLSGQVMVEKTRKDLKEASVRTIAARKAESQIQERVNLLTRADKIEEWAMSHGMIATDGLGQAASLVTHGANTH